MCGLFGFIRSEIQTIDPELIVNAFNSLGILAESRGVDASGFASIEPVLTRAQKANTGLMKRKTASFENITILKNTVPFHQLWDSEIDKRIDGIVADASVCIGHTRWASQGHAKAITNASPLLTSWLIGSHNGDVNKQFLNKKYDIRNQVGDTDSEAIYLALEKARRIDTRLCTLESIHGRVALAWYDRRTPQYTHLARGFSSPLYVASVGNNDSLWWASEEDWFYSLEKLSKEFVINEIIEIYEGTYLRIDNNTLGIVTHEFTPRKRISDLERAGFGKNIKKNKIIKTTTSSTIEIEKKIKEDFVRKAQDNEKLLDSIFVEDIDTIIDPDDIAIWGNDIMENIAQELDNQNSLSIEDIEVSDSALEITPKEFLANRDILEEIMNQNKTDNTETVSNSSDNNKLAIVTSIRESA